MSCDTFIKGFLGVDYHYCHHFSKNDYSECLLLSGLIMAISAGNILARLPLQATLIDGARKAREQQSAGGGAASATMVVGDEQTKAVLEENNIGGWTFDQWHLLTGLTTMCYLVMKMMWFTADVKTKDDFGLWRFNIGRANQTYKDITWQNWCNADQILNLSLLAGTMYGSYQSIKLSWTYRSINDGALHPVTGFVNLIFAADCIGSFVLICIKVGYLALYFYEAAVGFVVGMMLVCGFCFWLPCVGGVAICLSKIFSVLACGKDPDSGLGKVMQQIAGGITYNLVVFFVVAIMLCFLWLFNGKVPETYVVYFEDSGYENVEACLIAALVMGAITFVGGMVKALVGKSEKENLTPGW